VSASYAAGQRRLNRDIICIGASAGGVEAVRRLVSDVPADLPAAVFVVIHRGDRGPNLLPKLLGAVSRLRVVEAEEGQGIERGTVYVAPGDRHLLVGRDHVHVRRGPHENRTRPAIDPLFRSAAVHCSGRVIGVVLSGTLDDGTSGLMAIKRCGGLAVVQDPRDAVYPDMPQSALRHVEVDHVAPVAAMGELLAGLAAQPRPPAVEPPEKLRMEAMIPALEIGDTFGVFGPPSPFTCPECHGSLVEIVDDGFIRFRCHTGHAFTADALHEAQAESFERAIYDAMRSQEEQAMLARRIAQDAQDRGYVGGAADMKRRAEGYEEGANMLRQLLGRNGRPKA
jgi:two-component system chemotaxis response regulator CheB